jgi:uncharacterized protein YfaS (alpha-2-macroglobulin family)
MPKMKYPKILFILILVVTLGHAQDPNESYDALWKKVQKLENDDLTQSALKEVNAISQKAKKEGNSAQIVKALLFTSKYALILEEDAQFEIVKDFKSEIEKAEFPTKNVLESYLANLYWQYFQQNRYRFYDRTTLEKQVDPSTNSGKVDSTDFRTWNLTTIFHEIGSRFEASLKNKEGLQKTGLDPFQEILVDRSGSETYRPTLFDLLAHTALDFYKTDENNITRPTDKFEIDNPEILCEAYDYTQNKIETRDRTSLQAKALSIYQVLLEFHFSDPKLDAFVDVDVERLDYIHQNAVFTNKDSIYLEVLRNSAENLKQHEVSALYSHQIARLYHRQGNDYEPKTNEENRWKLKEALTLCESVIARFPDSRGAEKCKALKSEILATGLKLTTENYIPIDTKARLLVNYKNLDGLQLSALKISQKQLKQLNQLYPQTKQLAFLRMLPPAKKWEADLKNEKDYQRHGIEILLPLLDNGQYVILATPSDNNGENPKKQTFAFSPVHVTDMAVVAMQIGDSHIFQVVNRRGGHPISGAKLKFTYRKNYNRPYLNKSLTTDEEGMVSIPLSNDNWSDITVLVSHAGEEAHFGPYYIHKKYDTDDRSKITNTAFFFTDRSIYRPSQPLYFKGIVIENHEGKSTVATEENVFVSLYDANGQEVSSQNFGTNEFGSFSGEFMIPDNGLTGEYHIEIQGTAGHFIKNYYFSVEEYKRPKFETSFQPITKTFRVNDNITVQGNAAAYVGSNVTDTKVVYRVKRVVFSPRWYYWHHPYFNSSPQEIAHGETVTDASGDYEIDFKALPDNRISKETQPTFRYEVTADVTDINGETHTATTTVSVGYHALTASIEVPERLDGDKKADTLTITVKNLNGEPTDSRGTLKMYKLQAPDQVLRDRPWPAPDYKNWEKAVFKEMFPHDAYGSEHDPTTWEKGKLLWQSDFDTEKATEIPLGISKKWASGKYEIVLETTDKFGQKVKAVAQTTVYSDSDKTLADNQIFQIKADKENYAIGDKVEIQIASASKDLTVTVFVEKDKKIVDTQTFELDDNAESFTIPVTADDLGGFAVNYHFSAYNSFRSGSLSIAVPYPKTDLEIETLTFRDKLEPGTDETWAFKIKGGNGDKVSAELLASMYDASLDVFRGHGWSFNPLMRPTYLSTIYTDARQNFSVNAFRTYLHNDIYSFTPQSYDSFDWFGLSFGNRGYYRDGLTRRMKGDIVAPMEETEADEAILNEVVTLGYAGTEDKKEDGDPLKAPTPEEERNPKKDSPETYIDAVKIRKNLKETAFFFPKLRTDKEGNVSFNFTTPQALTRWKLQLLAHTESLESAARTLETVTQKELMVLPNIPRFLREGDEISVSTKIANLTDQELTGQAKLVLTDALTNEDISKKLLISSSEEEMPQAQGAGGVVSGAELSEAAFKADSMGNTQISWRLRIPDGLQAVQYKVIAKAGNFSDGEQNLLPVLTDRMLVTETLPMWVRSDQTKTFTLDKLKGNTSSTLKNHKLTLEITSDPAWYAVQALPYLMEYPYDCNEQTFARYYANSLASHIANSNPRIQEVFKQWASSDALISNLEKNEELKSLLIQETPWLREARTETEQKKRIALLFNLDKMKNEQANALGKLKNNQKPSGAWGWFSGGPDNRFITQHIIAGLGHLNKLSVTFDPSTAPGAGPAQMSSAPNGLDEMTRSAIAYLDDRFVEEYDRMKKYADDPNEDHLSPMQIHYLYMRSFYPDIKTSKKVGEITDHYKGQAQKYWTQKGLYPKGMLALALHRTGDTATANRILRSLRENSITSDELGMYWKENKASWHWYQAPIETQALIIEAFGEIHPDSHPDKTKTIDNLKVWLLKNKQTNQWKTTKATTEAVYALLLQGSDRISVTEAVAVRVGGSKIEPSKLDGVKVEAGTGYYKTSWNTNEIEPQMSEVQLSKKGDGIAWGALYWQYFEDLNKITSSENPLKLKKKLFLKKNTDTGEEISEITSKTELKVGDLVRVRIELRSDRDTEFLHMKDLRAAGFEPINVLSSYKWQDGLGHYESTKDASTNFFFDNLPKGVYVFEYDLRVNNAGEFSNGITTIQSMYSPEFSSHSEGVRVKVSP